MNRRKGLTLIELVLALSLFGLIIGLGTNIYLLSNKVQKVSAVEADIQAKTRLIAEQINNITRFATKTHTIPRSSFQYSENGVRDSKTSYIGVTKEGNVVIDEPGEEGKPRKVQYLAKKQKDIEYEIIFNKAYDNDGKELDTVLNFSIVGVKDGKPVTEIISNVEVLNSLNIEHLGTPSDPAVAIAFSMVDPGSQEWIEMTPDAYIALVLDLSGSMDWDMDGINNSTNQRRIAILKEKALKMIDRLAAMDFDIYVSLVPFGTNANDPKPFKNLNDSNEKGELIDQIKAMSADKGATNTGDGIRRGYYQLRNIADTLISSGLNYSDFTQHMMVLVDGGTNRESRTSNSSTNLFMNDGNITNSNWLKEPQTYTNVKVGEQQVCFLFWCWWEDILEKVFDNRYVQKIGNDLIKPYKYEFEGEQKQAINTFVIGFSNRTIDHVSLNDIGTSINAKQFEHDSGLKPYILAKDADELDFAFEQFESEVTNNLWVISRPKLWP